MAIKKQSSDKFYQKISSLANKNKFPLRAMFELTYRCNFRCVHCYVVADKNKKELNTTEVKKVLSQLKAAGCFHVGFTGGEPLLRKDIFEILDYAKGCGFRISLLTNGFLIDENASRRIASLGGSLNRVDVSVLGITKNTLEGITRKKGSFEKVMRAIRLLKDKGVDVQIKATLMKQNKDEFLRIKELAEKLDTMFRYSPMLNPKVDGDKTPLKYQVAPKDACRIKRLLSLKKGVINEQANEGLSLCKRKLRKPAFRCGAGRSEVTISPNGEMNICMDIHYPQYNILKGSFIKGWGKMKSLVDNLSLPKDYPCDSCSVMHLCQWCPAKELLTGRGRIKCNSFYKDMALTEAGQL